MAGAAGWFGGRPSKAWRVLARGALVGALLSCGARTAISLDEPAQHVGPSPGAAGMPEPAHESCVNPPQCVTRDSRDPCGAARLVDAQCDASTLAWRCPDQAWLYQRAAADAGECLPLQSGSPRVLGLSGSLSHFPTLDGRCLWVAEQLHLATGEVLNDVPFEPDPRAPFGTCPADIRFVGSGALAVVFTDGSSVDPNVQYVQVAGGFLSNGTAQIIYRSFRVDPSSV